MQKLAPLLLLGLITLAACDAPKPATIADIQAELNHMLDAKQADAWQKRLDPGFKSGFGGDDTKTSQAEFIKRITGDEAYRGEFRTVIATCDTYENGNMVCPTAWMHCPDGDYKCGGQTRIFIDNAKPDWKIQFYGAGD
jgi:hypothetical protein